MPKATSPRVAFSLSPRTLSRSQVILGPEKYASGTRPVLDFVVSQCRAFSSSAWSAVLLHCQTMALCSGSPVDLSQRMVVSPSGS